MVAPGIKPESRIRGGLQPRHYKHVPRPPPARGLPSDQKKISKTFGKEMDVKMTRMGGLYATSYFL